MPPLLDYKLHSFTSEYYQTENNMVTELRKPFDIDIDACTRLIYTSGPDLYRYIFATQEPAIYDYIKCFCTRTGSLFSKDNIILEVENGVVRGLILTYPARDMIKISMQMLKSIPAILRISGFKHFMKIMFRMGLNRYFPGTSKDELFISNFAVFAEYRGKGIGLTLLQKTEDIARENNLEKLSLYVEIDNVNAIRIYEKFGFMNVQKSILPQKYKRYNLFGFYKMVKEIETSI